MHQTKRTYALPASTLSLFEATVPVGERSRVVGELIQQWISEKERADLRARVIEGCLDMDDVSLELERDFHPLEEEVHRAVDPKPQSRRRRSGSA